MTTITILGNTKTSQELAKKIREKGHTVYNPKKQNKETLKQALKNNIILISTTKTEFEKTLHNIKNNVKHNTIIIDTLKNKTYSTQKMKEILPKSVHILSMYPYNEEKIGIIRVQTKLYMLNMVKHVLRKLGYKTIKTTPQEHDQKMKNTETKRNKKDKP